MKRLIENKKNLIEQAEIKDVWQESVEYEWKKPNINFDELFIMGCNHNDFAPKITQIAGD